MLFNLSNISAIFGKISFFTGKKKILLRAKLKYFLSINYKNYNFLNFDWFKKLLFPTDSLACQVVIGQFVIGQLVIGQFVIGQFNKPIKFKVVV